MRFNIFIKFVLAIILAGFAANVYAAERTITTPFSKKHAVIKQKHFDLSTKKSGDRDPVLKKKHKSKGVEVAFITINQHSFKCYYVYERCFALPTQNIYARCHDDHLFKRGPPSMS